ncbi:MAG TPA: hypothetical protein VG405_11685 [Solirubrobacteraceae bacterium]|jgi:Na+/glutamate symporter|nr:hypothetical protein [Solirubrobacteraceae bacterium]
MNEPEKYPPFTELAMLSLALIVAGGIYLSAHLPEHVSLTLPVILLVLSGALMVLNLGSLARIRHFDWERFWSVGRWSLLAYVVIAGLIEYVFLQNHLSGGPLVVLTLSLVLFAIHVPALVGFTVARYYDVPPAGPPEGAAVSADLA